MKHPQQESESELQQAILQLAEAHNWKAYHVVNVKRNIRNRSSIGFPDIVLAHATRGIIFAELKSKTGKVSADQEEWISVLHNAALVRPAESYLWRSDNWKEIERRIKG